MQNKRPELVVINERQRQMRRAADPAAVAEFARVCEEAAEFLPTTSRLSAIALLTEAAERYEAIGARDDVARVERSLHRLGVRRLREARRPFSWDALTSSEREVAELVACGLRNKEIAGELFVSVRTVESHVSHALQKLGIKSRVELAAAALSYLSRFAVRRVSDAQATLTG